MPSIFKPLSHEHLNELQRELAAAVRDKYEDANKLDIVTTVLIPHFRAELEKAIGAVPHAQDRSLTPDEIDALCSAVDSILKTQDVLLNAKPERLFDPVIAAMQNIRQRVRVELTEEFYAVVRASLREHGVVDMRTLIEKKVNWLQQTIFENLGTGLSLTSQILGRKITKTKIGDLIEMAEILGLENNMFPKMDEVYFQNKDNIRYDLGALAKKNGVQIEDLNVYHARVTVIFKNGEELTGRGYLNRAAVALGLVAKAQEAEPQQGEALTILKKRIGIHIPECTPMDRKYFENAGNVRHDLTAFALSKKTTITKLRLTTRDKQKILCKNGEKLTGMAYLRRAAVALCIVPSYKEAEAKAPETLRILKNKIDIKIMDESYFNEAGNVKKDLEAFAAALGITVDELNTANFLMKKIIANNGEEIAGYSYLSRAAVALHIAKNKRKGQSEHKKILSILKRIIGIKIPNEMDRTYFENRNNILHDLMTIAQIKGVSVDNLKTTRSGHSRFSCHNGEIITLQTYLHRAAVALGLAQNDREARSMQGRTLAILKRKIGIEA